MITLITAVPGSGKTLYSISLIVAALNDSRPVYTNINGLVKDKFPNPHLLFDAPDDWRDCPEGSFIVYDEAQQAHLYPSNAQRGKVEDPRLTALETHRHHGYDLVFITQAPTFVHHHIRKLVGSHIHLYRAKGVGGAARHEWSHTCDSPNDRNEQKRAETVIWKFPKEYFPYYTSAVMHTHKFRLPVKITVLFSVIMITIIYLSYSAYNSGGLALFSDKSPVNKGRSEQGQPSPPLQLLPSSNSSTTWKLDGYVLQSGSILSSNALALISSSNGRRIIDFSLCDFDDFRMSVTCVVDGSTVTFYTGKETKRTPPTNSSNPFSR